MGKPKGKGGKGKGGKGKGGKEKGKGSGRVKEVKECPTKETWEIANLLTKKRAMT
jgi:hypothetical protein